MIIQYKKNNCQQTTINRQQATAETRVIRIIRIAILIIYLGVFSAIYTYMGGLNAVVKTDIIQFAMLFSCARYRIRIGAGLLGSLGILHMVFH